VTVTSPPPLAAAGRTLTRRPGLPGGRAVVGALLVVTAGVGTFTLGRDGGDESTGHYAVLTRAVDPGEELTTDALDWRPLSLDDEIDGRAFHDRGELDGAVALVPLAAGELVQRSVVRRGDAAGTESLPEAQLSIPVPIDRTPPGLRRGEHVTLLATYGSGDNAVTVRTVESAVVLGYESDPDAIGAHDRGRLTLALADAGALIATAHAAQVAELTVVRSTGTATAVPESYRRIDEVDRTFETEAVR
jgi:hypothetical protein